VALLVLLNGPPACGKSTIAERLVATRPLAMRLDIDVVRGLLGDWLQRPTDAGLAARALAISMALTHLAAGHDVFVPQFLGRPEFIDELAALAVETGSTFVEIALVLDRESARSALAERTADPQNDTHRDAAALVEQSGGTSAVDEMFDRYEALLDQRPGARRVEVERGDIDATVRAVEVVLSIAASRSARPERARPSHFSISHAPTDYRCPFCLNIRDGTSDLPLEFIHRDDDVVVKMNPNWRPNNPGSVLVIPTEHHENIFDVPDRLALPIHRAARNAAVAMKVAFGCDAVSTRQHNEPAGNQTVWHFHLHVFPRWENDDLYGTRDAPADETELRDLARQLRAAWPAATAM